MALIAAAQFSKFLKRYASKCPYSEVSKTRRRFYVKWIVTNKPTFGYPPSGVPHNDGCYTAIPSKCLNDDLVQYLIVSKEALPVPPLMSTVLDWMHCWGRGQDIEWHHKVVDWIHLLLSQHIHVCDRLVVRDCVEFRVRHVLREAAFENNAFAWSNALAAWQVYFDDQCSLGNTGFYELADKSIQFALAMEDQLSWVPTNNVMSSP